MAVEEILRAATRDNDGNDSDVDAANTDTDTTSISAKRDAIMPKMCQHDNNKKEKENEETTENQNIIPRTKENRRVNICTLLTQRKPYSHR